MSTPIKTVLIYGYGVMAAASRDLRRRGVRHPREEQPRGKARSGCRRGRARSNSCRRSTGPRHRIVPEDVRVKQGVYAEIEAAYSGNSPDKRAADCVGTSGSIWFELARKMKRPERFLGVHYFMAGRHRAGGRSDGGTF